VCVGMSILVSVLGSERGIPSIGVDTMVRVFVIFTVSV